ncbi:hypothetical protein [Streptomyces iranensis]|uniref:Uncharacterized protein n=1 Tax=Streptomyces iranensis TaxID=576784 RepID=A0A061AC57_9ACTN|nr:hypothetical protein [Streptomyces iranensis]MBP2064302.1 hypothetical protein [Streptomyces iranensis]CDR17437.1 predicted protein [Streptomyces iranensis]
MTITDETLVRLRSAAAAGDAQAALRVGRLLCLTAADPTEPGDGEPTWPEEPWLRAAVAAHPDDVEALALLTGRLAQQISYWEACLDMNPDVMKWYGEDEGTVERRHIEAEKLYARIRAAGPTRHAGAGLDELAVLLGVGDKPVAECAYSFYVMEDEAWSGSVRHSATIVASDAAEIRWACDKWFTLSQGGIGGEPTLTAYADGAEVGSVGLGPHLADGGVDWDAVAVPGLSGSRLPAGLPVPGRGLHYGFAGGAE